MLRVKLFGSHVSFNSFHTAPTCKQKWRHHVQPGDWRRPAACQPCLVRLLPGSSLRSKVSMLNANPTNHKSAYSAKWDGISKTGPVFWYLIADCFSIGASHIWDIIVSLSASSKGTIMNRHSATSRCGKFRQSSQHEWKELKLQLMQNAQLPVPADCRRPITNFPNSRIPSHERPCHTTPDTEFTHAEVRSLDFFFNAFCLSTEGLNMIQSLSAECLLH